MICLILISVFLCCIVDTTNWHNKLAEAKTQGQIIQIRFSQFKRDTNEAQGRREILNPPIEALSKVCFKRK